MLISDAPSPTTSTAGYMTTLEVGSHSPDGDSSKALERTEYEGLQASRNDSETRQDSQHTARSTDQSPDDGTNKGDALDPTASNEGKDIKRLSTPITKSHRPRCRNWTHKKYGRKKQMPPISLHWRMVHRSMSRTSMVRSTMMVRST